MLGSHSTPLTKDEENSLQKAKIDALIRSFELFTEQTSRLEVAYGDLKQQFEQVNIELEEANETLNQKVLELDFATRYLNGMIDHISQGIIFIQLDGIMTTFSPAAERLLGKIRHRVLLKKFWDFFPDHLFGFSLKEALKTKEAPDFTFINYTTAGGSLYQLEISTTFVLEGESQGLIILIRDVTEIRQLEMIAARNDRMKELGEMAAQVAHEIRNPLGGIKGFASLLERDLKDKPEQQQMARYIVDGADTLNRLVTDILHYSRPVQVKYQTVDLAALLSDVKNHMEVDENKSDQIVIELKLPKKSIETSIDHQLFKQGLLNLIVNAMQVMPNGGKIILSLELKDHEALIRVADNGPGIAKENLEKIFSPFFTTKADGHGFGLSEVYKMIQAHRGRIEVDSTVGKGTVFTLHVPFQ